MSTLKILKFGTEIPGRLKSFSKEYCADNDGKKRKSSKEGDLTVKPIRQKLEESKSSLKETLKVGIQASELRSLQTQAAGHGSEVTFVLSTRRRL